MSEPILYDYGTREKWLEARREFVGASEVAVLFGLAPASWGSPYSLWAQKTGRDLPPPLVGEWLQWGTKLEPLISAEYEERTGRKIWRAPSPWAMAIDPKLDVLRCTLDGWIVDAPGMPGNGDLQIKCTSSWMGWKWDDGIPDHIKCQVQSEMGCTGLEWASTPVLEGGSKFRHFDVLRDEKFIDEIREQVAWFWDFVKRDTPPPLDGRAATTACLKRLHPEDSGETVELGSEAMEALEEWTGAKGELKAAKEMLEPRKDEAENRLRALIGGATFAVLPDGRRLSLKTTSRGSYTVEPTSYRTLRLESVSKRKR